MSGTFDEKGAGSQSTGKRPAPTIEGTATEVPAEPGADEATAGAAATDETTDHTTDDTTAGETETPALEAASADAESQETLAQAQDDTTDADDSDSGDESGDGTDHALETATPPPAAGSSAPSLGARLLAFVTALFTHALAGIAGGLAVLAALIWGYLPATVQPAGDAGADSGLARIENRIAALETAPKTPDTASALADLKSRLAALESAAPATSTASVDPAEVKALADQVAEVETRLKSLADAAKDGGSVADAAAISQQVAEAEQRLDTQLQTKIQSEVKSALAGVANASADDKTVQALKSEVAALDGKLKALTKATMDADDAAKLKPEIAALQRRLNEIESTLPALVDAVDAENAQTRKANLAIAFTGLRDAVNSGRPFATELTAMGVLSSDKSGLEALIEHENTGIPIVPMLIASFASLRDQALAAQSGADEDLLGRLLGSAQSLVKVRRVGEEAEGNGPDAILARAQAKLDAGELHQAVLEVERLDGPQAKIFGPWIDEALARLDADTALQQLQEALLVSFAGHDAGGKTESPAADEETE